MNKKYRLTKGASADLQEITRYTNAQWGAAQCLSYIGELEKAALDLANGEGAFKDLSVLHPYLHMARCGRHFIFCVRRPTGIPIILAILHERMDIMERLSSRLI